MAKMATVSGLGKRELEAELKEAVKGMLITTHVQTTIIIKDPSFKSLEGMKL